MFYIGKLDICSCRSTPGNNNAHKVDVVCQSMNLIYETNPMTGNNGKVAGKNNIAHCVPHNIWK